MPKIPKIKKIKSLGDSLSDRGAMWDKRLGIIPMRNISGLAGKSTQGSFTNGFAWSDHLASILANKYIIEELKQQKKIVDVTDIADAIIHQELSIKDRQQYYNLKDEKTVKYKNKEFFISYCEGGLTAYDYSWWPSINIKRFITRLFLSCLAEKRGELIQDDETNKTTMMEKAETLIIEWSGANDLITANAKPSLEEVDSILYERMKNAEELIQHGYRNFVLFNLPDLALTPCYQAKSAAERSNASLCVREFNIKLLLMREHLLKMYPSCNIQIFDVYSEFNNMYDNPEAYNLDRKKLTIPYTHSDDFKMLKDGTSPAKKYMFWDDVHPTADVHLMLANIFYKQFRKIFNFISPCQQTSNSGLFTTKHVIKSNLAEKSETTLVFHK